MRRQSGFTFIELIVVITIISLITGVSIIAALGGLTQRRDANRVTHAASIQTIVEFYLAEHKNFDEILATDGVVKTQYGQTFTEAVYYSTPMYPSTVPGRHPWNLLDGYLAKYNNGLPLDPLNDYIGWNALGEPNYLQWDIKRGYIIVRLRSIDVLQPTGCPGKTLRAAYIVETIQEKQSNKYVDVVREPDLFGCMTIDSPYRHVMRLWGILK